LRTLEPKKALHYAAASAEMDTNSQRKNMSNFRTWSQESLAEFAQQANEKMIQQNDRIEQLQCDLKDAIAAYRELLRKGPSA
jgi:hypothetical protein